MTEMTEQDIIQYVKDNTSLFDKDNELSIKEISDGNINYVYRVKNHEKSIIVKYSTGEIRTSGNPLSTDRNRIETNALYDEGKLAQNYVPEIYHNDEKACILIMEDLFDYQNLRYALINEQQFTTLGKDLVDFLTKTLLLTTDFVMNPMVKKEKVKSYINPMLCGITERLVFTEPYDKEINTNVLTKENEEFLIKELYNDEQLKFEVSIIKNNFKNKAQSLLHGDLHTGSIFVKEGSTKILDPEFAFYGPAGYDIGNVIANLLFAWARCFYTTKNEEFLNYIQQMIVEIVDGFKIKGCQLLQKEITDRSSNNGLFIDYIMRDILSDTAGMSGTELIRRIIGDAKVKDITTIPNVEQKCKAEQFCVLVGKELIMNRMHILNSNEYLSIIEKVKGRV